LPGIVPPAVEIGDASAAELQGCHGDPVQGGYSDRCSRDAGPGREIAWKLPPLAARAEQIDDSVEGGAHVRCAWTTSRPGCAAPRAPIARGADLKGSTGFACSSPRGHVHIPCQTSRSHPELPRLESGANYLFSWCLRIGLAGAAVGRTD